jgi:hypothetical protein
MTSKGNREIMRKRIFRHLKTVAMHDQNIKLPGDTAASFPVNGDKQNSHPGQIHIRTTPTCGGG